MIGSAAELERNLSALRERVAAAARRAGRDARDVTLVAVAKGIPPEVVAWAARAGIEAVGENYVNELERTRRELEEGSPGLRWHFVGVLQSGTAHRVADLADVVHTVGSSRAAARLSGRAERAGRRLPVLVEVDFAGRGTGAAAEDAGRLVDEARSLPGLAIRGLMTIPPMTPDPEDARSWFRRLRALRDALGDLPDLSMGMSADYEVAVEEGATMIRIGTALFGDRSAAE
jgi:PLP dependent protein